MVGHSSSLLWFINIQIEEYIHRCTECGCMKNPEILIMAPTTENQSLDCVDSVTTYPFSAAVYISMNIYNLSADDTCTAHICIYMHHAYLTDNLVHVY